jgi:hypothetical protein
VKPARRQLMTQKPNPMTCPSDIPQEFRSDWLRVANTEGPEIATGRIRQNIRELDRPYDADGVKPEKKPPAKKIRSVSSHEALLRLSVGDDPPSGSLSLTWFPGTKPGKLPIDNFIEDMLASRDARAKRLKERMQTGVVRCPYYAARLGVHIAASLAEMAESKETSIVEGKRYLKRKQSEGEKALAAIEAFVSDLKSNFFAPMQTRRTSRPNFSELNKALSAATAAADVCRSAPQAIKTLIELAEQECSRFPSEHNANHWAKGFTEAMGRSWNDIFGEEPKRKTRPFIRFVTDGYASIVGDSGPWDWETQVKDVIDKVEKREQWDRFKRHFDENYPGDFDPPGITFSTPEESRARADTIDETTINKLAEEAVCGDPRRAAAALVTIGLISEGASAIAQARIEQLVDRIFARAGISGG